MKASSVSVLIIVASLIFVQKPIFSQSSQPFQKDSCSSKNTIQTLRKKSFVEGIGKIKLLCKGYCKNEDKIGWWTCRYSKSGKIFSKKHFSDSGITDTIIQFDESERISFIIQKNDSCSTYKRCNKGKVTEKTKKCPNKRIKKSFFDDGSLYLLRKKKSGSETLKKYYKNGSLKMKKEFNSSGKLHGVKKQWYRSGKLKSVSVYDNGKLNGKHEVYYRNGNRKKVVPYQKGIKDGVIKFFNKDGHVDKKIVYENGKPKEYEGFE